MLATGDTKINEMQFLLMGDRILVEKTDILTKNSQHNMVSALAVGGK